MTKTSAGKIESFDRSRAQGRLTLEDGKTQTFSSTSFFSPPPSRFPKKDELVDVVFSEAGNVLSVRARGA